MNNINNWVHQDDKTFDFNVCDRNDYIKKMGYQIGEGMVFSASLWGSADINMDWLDGMTGCQGTCDLSNSHFSMSNFRIEKNSSIVAEPIV
jgi:hypothetical protein